MPSPNPSPPRRTARRLVGKVGLSLLAFTTTLVLIEGVASLVVVARKLVSEGTLVSAVRRHLTYDSLLGWCNEKGVVVEDMFGPGIDIHINSQGFRAPYDYAREVPAGKLRIICTGDSFTLGIGVRDDETWVTRLQELEPRFETVNMGQGGYGVDQAFLWYRRDGMELEHDIHLFAFISDDFLRAQRLESYGYPKPMLRVVDGELVTDGVPVPPFLYHFPFLTQNRALAQELRAVELVRAQSADRPTRVDATDEEHRATVVAMFEELARMHSRRGSLCVAVHLPATRKASNLDIGWSQFLDAELSRLGIPYITLFAELQSVTAPEAKELFLYKSDVLIPVAEGHYSGKGNEWAARAIHTKLMELPEVESRLGRL